MDELNKKLKPCPFCGGQAHVEELEQNDYGLRMKITCLYCGASLNWVQDYDCYTKKDPLYGERVVCRAAKGINPIEAWNRRANE